MYHLGYGILNIENESLQGGQLVEPFHRYEVIYRGRDGFENPDKGVLAENKFVKLTLKDISSSQLYLLLSRITARTHIPVEVGQIKVDFPWHPR